MLTARRALRIAMSVVLFLGAAGCATQSLKSTIEMPKLPTMPSMPTAVAGEPGRVDGPSSDIYGLIASGALTCWFAANGQLKKSHIFHADADPLAKGGAVEIAVMERDVAGPRPWGARAFKVALAQSGEQTTIEIENSKMPDAIAVLMRADVYHWAQGGKDCKLKPAEVVAAPPVPVPAKKKVKPKAARKVTAAQ